MDENRAAAPQPQHRLSWREETLPVSGLFDDPFYSRNDGRAEAAYVFLDGNGLPGRWAERACFAIAELGFGTGLNMLETWRQWRATRKPGQALRLTSFERYPLAPEDAARALSAWPELDELTGELVGRWRAAAAKGGLRDGSVWREALDPATELAVVVGTAHETVPQWRERADAWYLDGFSPAKNGDMWSLDLMASVAGRSAPAATFATYTAAGWVRRNLEAAGFRVEKRPGHGGKREMMFGRLGAETEAAGKPDG